jgi:UDPglucose 6-dehydrogenase
MAIIAMKCPQYKVHVVDVNEARITAWNTDDLSIYEPWLLDVVKAARGRNLFFSADIDAAICEAEVVFVSVNTPTKSFGDGAGRAADLQFREKVVRQIFRVAASPKIVVEKGALPVKTAQTMETILNAAGNQIHFEAISNPEFLVDGTAVQDLLHPDRSPPLKHF